MDEGPEKNFYWNLIDRGKMILNCNHDEVVLLRDNSYDFIRNFETLSAYNKLIKAKVSLSIPMKGPKKKSKTLDFNFCNYGKYLRFPAINHDYLITDIETLNNVKKALHKESYYEEGESKIFKSLRKLIEEKFEIDGVYNIKIKDFFDPFEGGSRGFTLEFRSWEGWPKKKGNLLGAGRVKRITKTYDLDGRKVSEWRLTGTHLELTKDICRILNDGTKHSFDFEKKTCLLIYNGFKIKDLELWISKREVLEKNITYHVE